MYKNIITYNNINMIREYKIKIINNKEVLYLYVDYLFEFANIDDIDNKFNVINNIKDFIKSKGLNFSGENIYIISNGITVANLKCRHYILDDDTFVNNSEIIEINNLYN